MGWYPKKRRSLFTWTQHPRISKVLSPGPFGIASAAKEASGAVSVKKGKSCQSVWVIISARWAPTEYKWKFEV